MIGAASNAFTTTGVGRVAEAEIFFGTTSAKMSGVDVWFALLFADPGTVGLATDLESNGVAMGFSGILITAMVLSIAIETSGVATFVR